MTKRPAGLAPALGVLALLFLLFALLSAPMRHGASLWEAIAVLPQAVLWIIPPALATPILLALAFRIRPRWNRLRDPELTVVPTGSLAPLAESLRRASESRLARSRVVSRLVHISTDIAICQYGGAEEWASEMARRRLRAIDPRIAEFLEHHETLDLSDAEFRNLVEDSLAELERQQQEA
jgi:hypothetical protein